jgi:hypothetical protein
MLLGNRLILAICALIGIWSVAFTAPGAALATRGHVFSTSFGKTGSAKGELSEPAGVAVDEESKDVYVVDKGNNRVEDFTATGTYRGQFNGSGEFEVEGKEEDGTPAPTGAFSSPESIAVDNACTVKKLTPSVCASVDPSNGDVYVVDAAHGVVDKFSADGAYLGQITGTICLDTSGCKANELSMLFPFLAAEPFEGLEAVAVDASGTVWVYEEPKTLVERVDKFSNGPTNAFESSVSTEKTHGIPIQPFLAVGCKGELYVGIFHGGNELIAAVSPEGEVLSSAIESDHSVSGLALEADSCDVYIDGGASVGRFTGAASATSSEELERFEVPGGGGSGVGVDASDEDVVYVADASQDVVDVFSLEPPGPPTIAGAFAAEVTSDSAALHAEVNPRGAETEYSFEYGRCGAGGTTEECATAGYEPPLPAPPGLLGASFEVSNVSLNVQGLLPDTAYHARANVRSKLGSATSSEVVFTTSAAGGFALPDKREWELVSPPDKLGARIETDFEGELTIQAAADGRSVTYATTAPTEAAPEGYTNFMQVLSTHGGAGWRSHDIGIGHAEATGQEVGQGTELRFFSSQLDVALVAPYAGFDPNISLAAHEQTPYLRTNYENGNLEEECAHECFAPLVTGCPAAGEPCAEPIERAADVPPGTKFSTSGACPLEKEFTCGPHFEGATNDLSHVVVSSEQSLTSTRVPGGLYEWNEGHLQLVSLLPTTEGGKPVAGGLGIGEHRGGKQAGAISQDGTRVIWTPIPGEEGLYMRDTETGETLRLDQVQGGSESGSQKPVFQGASSDGSAVFFTDEQQLTANSDASSGEPDLYECAVRVEAGKLTCALSDLTPEKEKDEEPGDAIGSPLGISQDGEWVYFVARGALQANGNASGERPTAHTDNLYVRHEGTTTFIAALAGADSPDWSVSEESSEQAFRSTARVSPNGAWLAFMSQQSLTGYDNRDAASREPDEEVFLYDGETGHLVCASCNPTGERPTGLVATEGSLALGEGKVWPAGVGVAANVPGWTSPFYQSRYLSNSGRLFFNSHEALVPQDENGTWDVYEYEPPGVGSCTTGASTFGRRSGGCVDLISSGTSAEESVFLDASEEGSDVFFLTAAKLVPQDKDTALDIYDAHECDSTPCVAAVPVPPAACNSEASCRPQPAPQTEIFGPPPSASFSGAGNLVEEPKPTTSVKPKAAVKCKRGFVKSKGKCVKQRKHPKRKGRASREHRGGHARRRS